MPEIAEVETVRRTLKRQILKKRIKEVKILYPKIILNHEEEFKKILIGNQFLDIKRRGKWLIFELENHYLLSHLRMEGKFFLKNVHAPIEKHEHVVITFSDDSDLRYHDTRKFGRMELILKEDLNTNERIQKQGFEPGEKGLTSDYLLEKFHDKNVAIKTLLLDQTIISGLGNIYANEVLFASKINPFKKGSQMTKKEAEAIVENSQKIIERAIELGGTTIKSYTSSLGITGRFQQELMVHKREGMPCLICKTKIKREKINGRSTYYCPKCQKTGEGL